MRKAPILLVAVALLLSGAAPVWAPDPTPAARDPRYPHGNDPRPTGQWNLYSFSANAAPGPSGISADLAWGVTDGHPGVVIGVLDSGVDYDHEDLRNKIWLNPGELPTPNDAGAPCASDDCNGDGVFNVRDFARDDRVTDANGSGARDRGDLAIFADGVDDDENGYRDDLSGWDTDDDDGDHFDHRYYGHGTGRHGILAPETALQTETGPAVGVAGICPDCMLMDVRIYDHFVHPGENVAKGAIYAIDGGAKVLNMALGGQNASPMSRGAFEYATANDVLAVNASANEDSAHHNFQSVFDEVMTIGAVTANNRSIATTTWRQKGWYSNFGAHLDVVAPSEVPGAAMALNPDGSANHAAYTGGASGTSSATPHAAGVAGLVFSRGLETGLTPPLSAQEVRQILNGTADDIDVSHGTSYPVQTGWDRWTGYGRINAKEAVDAVTATTIPPEADINAPDWYSLVSGRVPVRFYANARRAASFGWTLEVGSGVEPASFTTLASAANVPADPSLSSADLLSTVTHEWHTPPQNGLYTLRLRVTDSLGNVAEDRMSVWLRLPDPHDLRVDGAATFPRTFGSSIESLSVAAADLDADGDLEVIFADGGGAVHALRIEGGEIRGFPVRTLAPILPLAASPAFDGNPANGEVPVAHASIVGGVAVGDLERDGTQEVLAAATDGRLYCWEAHGAPCPGFPAATDPGTSRQPYGSHAQVRNAHPEDMVATPALGNLDADAELEIVAGSIDAKLYVWNHDGSRLAPWPIVVRDPSAAPATSRLRPFDVAPHAILSTAAVGDVDADGAGEIVVGTTEVYSTPDHSPPVPGTSGSGRLYLLEADGSIAPGWPVKPTSLAPNSVPLVAQGIGTSPVVADVEGDARKEIIAAPFLGDTRIYSAGGTEIRALQGAPFGTAGAGGNDLDELAPEGNLASPLDWPLRHYVAQGAVADMDADGRLDYLAGAVGNRIVTAAADPGNPVVFDHLLAAWDATTGMQKAFFPRVMEDWQFLNGPAIADLTGDGLPEAVESSGGFYVHAFDHRGGEPAGWPKLTGHWQTATPAIADLDGDGDAEVIQATRLGAVFVWSMGGDACEANQWRKFHSDEWNTGVAGTDTRPPGIAAGLRARRTGGDIVLGWTAPGDDGRCGTAAAYDVRVSDEPITPATFTKAKALPAPPPSPPGTTQSQRLGSRELASGARTSPWLPGRRYVAVRALDEAGNPGPLATVALCTLPATVATPCWSGPRART